MNKKALFATFPQAVQTIIDEKSDRDTTLLKVCQLLHENVDTYDWVGFYIADPEVERELYLGPYVGEATDHTRIPFGVGICGQVADSHETFVVDDVTAQDNYLACSLHVKSEIVVPIMKNGTFMAQLDIDSHTVAAMDEIDQSTLEIICEMLTDIF